MIVCQVKNESGSKTEEKISVSDDWNHHIITLFSRGYGLIRELSRAKEEGRFDLIHYLLSMMAPLIARREYTLLGGLSFPQNASNRLSVSILLMNIYSDPG